jgi:hypothetical protein
MNNKVNHVTEEQLLKAIAELEKMAKAERYEAETEAEEAERYSCDDPYGNDECLGIICLKVSCLANSSAV